MATVDLKSLVAKFNEPCRRTLEAAAGRIPVVGVGGVDSAERAFELLEAGCVAVQLYTAMIYEGPGLPQQLVRELAARAAQPSVAT